MKGATAEPDVKTTRLPSRARQRIIGKSQNFFRSLMNDHNSKRKSPMRTSRVIREQSAVRVSGEQKLLTPRAQSFSFDCSLRLLIVPSTANCLTGFLLTAYC